MELFKTYIIHLIYYFNYFVLFYFLIINGFYAYLSIIAAKELIYYLRRISFSVQQEIDYSPLTPPISIIVPAFNEELTIIDNIKSIEGLNYPEFEIIIINDGSKDATLQLLIENFQLVKVPKVVHKKLPTKDIKDIYESSHYLNIIVIDKINGGKSDSLNTGINVSRYPLFCAIDADCILEKNSLLMAVKPFLERPDVMIATGGIVRVANGCTINNGIISKIKLSQNPISILQVIEYLRSFLIGRLGWSALKNLLIISGAFGLFKKSSVLKVGGYKTDTIGEDLELILALHAYNQENNLPYEIKFLPDPVCWTQVPDSFTELRKQRQRWQVGLMNSLFRYRHLLFNPKYGSIGFLSLPYYWLFEMLGCLVEFFGYIVIPLSLLFKIINIDFFVMFLLSAILFGILLSLASILLEEFSFRKYPSFIDIITLFLYSIIENLFFRQLIAYWRTEAFFKYLFKRYSWNSSKRKVFKEST